MRHRVRMNKNNSYAKRSRSGNVHPRIEAPLLLTREEQSIDEIQSGLNEINDSWNALEASWNDLKDSWDDPRLKDIDLQDMFSHPRPEQGEERQAGNTHFSSMVSKDLSEPELQYLDFIPARDVPGMTNNFDDANLIWTTKIIWKWQLKKGKGVTDCCTLEVLLWDSFLLVFSGDSGKK